MNTWDLALLVILLLGAYRGYTKGILMELVALVAFVVAIVGALQLMSWGVGFLSDTLQTDGAWLSLLAFVLLFVGILTGVSIAGKMLKSVVHLTPIGYLDGLLGAAVGVVKWAFGISVIFIILDYAEVALPNTDDSELYGYVHPFAYQVVEKFREWFPALENIVDAIRHLFRSATSRNVTALLYV
ncbi:MAG: CvpA family protein [Tunicatimonas sp.]